MSYGFTSAEVWQNALERRRENHFTNISGQIYYKLLPSFGTASIDFAMLWTSRRSLNLLNYPVRPRVAPFLIPLEQCVVAATRFSAGCLRNRQVL
jgi:hypothetical protein